MENRKKRKEISARTRHHHKSLEQCLEEAPWRQPEDASQVVEVSDATDDSLPLSALKNTDAKKTECQATSKTSSPSAQENMGSSQVTGADRIPWKRAEMGFFSPNHAEEVQKAVLNTGT
eukprot:6150947-Amphidinium_carterae.2